MEPHQEEHIRKNKEALVKNTITSPIFFSIFEQTGCLSSEEICEINGTPNRYRNARLFYDIIVTKQNSYNVLHYALTQCCQTGAVAIIQPLVTETIKDISTYIKQASNDAGTSNTNTVSSDMPNSMKPLSECKKFEIVKAWLDSGSGSIIVSNWSHLAYSTDLSSAKIEELRNGNKQILDIIIYILEQWTQKKGPPVTLGDLINKLEILGWNDYSRIVKKQYNIPETS